ncbi:MAG: hypothetical protein ABFS56_22715 [Pseudomonadota bacterium]
MTVQHLAISDLKTDIYKSLEQLTPDRLADLSLFLEQLLKIINAYIVNDSEFTQSYQLLQAEQPWLKYTAILKESPNWDEFLEILAEARREEDEEI